MTALCTSAQGSLMPIIRSSAAVRRRGGNHLSREGERNVGRADCASTGGALQNSEGVLTVISKQTHKLPVPTASTTAPPGSASRDFSCEGDRYTGVAVY
jgi:hypothetical protein